MQISVLKAINSSHHFRKSSQDFQFHICVQIYGFECNRLAFVNFLSVAAVKSTEFKTSAQVWHGELNIRFSFFFTFPIWNICISYLKHLYFWFEAFVFLIWSICISYLKHLYFSFDAFVFLIWRICISYLRHLISMSFETSIIPTTGPLDVQRQCHKEAFSRDAQVNYSWVLLRKYKFKAYL